MSDKKISQGYTPGSVVIILLRDENKEPEEVSYADGIRAITDAFYIAHGLKPESTAQDFHSMYPEKPIPMMIDMCVWGVENGLMSQGQLDSFTRMWQTPP